AHPPFAEHFQNLVLIGDEEAAIPAGRDLLGLKRRQHPQLDELLRNGRGIAERFAMAARFVEGGGREQIAPLQRRHELGSGGRSHKAGWARFSWSRSPEKWNRELLRFV